MEISIVILNWNDRTHLVECLRSLENCGKTRSMEIIVVDNASTDGSPQMVAEQFPNVKLIRNEVNIGFPKGNNMGMAASTGKYIYLLNSDIKVLGDCVEKLAVFMDENPRVGMCGPRILNADMTHQSSCRRFPSLWNNFVTAVGLARFSKKAKFLSGEHMYYFNGEKKRAVDVLVGCFWVVRRTAMAEFGSLDEDFFMYAEDVDWCRRCWESHWRVMFTPVGEAIHYRGGSSQQDLIRCAVTQQASILRYWKKHHGSVSCFWMRMILMLHLLIRFSGALLNYLVKPSARNGTRGKLVLGSACLRALVSRPADEPSA